ncbi:M23 family metallopeptidase [Neptunomonas japonica]|uniref:M23 family metallopeptidase n=1 Tax=Neptunomonas japonica TaxID=417574 RepID=UPI00146B6C6C|nr:M23 family metallopeptidase [Neptunomonas japonica]
MSPTDTETTHIRQGNGQFGAKRKEGVHGGTDIVVRASHSEKSAYAVFVVASGKVAYVRMNGTEEAGYGNIIVVDHGNDCYSAYAHLANDPFTPRSPGDNLNLQVGDELSTGTILGYFVRTDADIDSTGNARRTHPEARHQIHFELISAPSGRTGSGSLKNSIMPPPAKRINPEKFLIGVGLSVE